MTYRNLQMARKFKNMVQLFKAKGFNDRALYPSRVVKLGGKIYLQRGETGGCTLEWLTATLAEKFPGVNAANIWIELSGDVPGVGVEQIDDQPIPTDELIRELAR